MNKPLIKNLRLLAVSTAVAASMTGANLTWAAKEAPAEKPAASSAASGAEPAKKLTVEQLVSKSSFSGEDREAVRGLACGNILIDSGSVMIKVMKSLGDNGATNDPSKADRIAKLEENSTDFLLKGWALRQVYAKYTTPPSEKAEEQKAPSPQDLEAFVISRGFIQSSAGHPDAVRYCLKLGSELNSKGVFKFDKSQAAYIVEMAKKTRIKALQG